VKENKIIYWLNFIETQVGKSCKIIMIATKFDKIESNFIFSKEQKTKEYLLQIEKCKSILFLFYIFLHFIYLILYNFYLSYFCFIILLYLIFIYNFIFFF
jgi:hypothetical protein